MQPPKLLSLEYSYCSLPDKFYSLVAPAVPPKPEVALFNSTLAKALGIDCTSPEALIAFLWNESTSASAFAQAYAGHQFGHFTKLGDGRAIIIGEGTGGSYGRFDIQLKGAGITPYSRRGDGKATLKAMLREYLISEAMQGLGIASSRSLAVIKTGAQVHRENLQEGAVLVRIMQSHLRIGTFEYARQYGTPEDLKILTDYTLARLFPALAQQENPALALLEKVIELQIHLIADWMRVGFIHGVMNTDNVAISGETFDYGPCAFMNVYHPATVFSSIDSQGRYAFGNQARIIKWNITRLAEALLPLMHQDIDKAVQLAQASLDAFDARWKAQYYGTMLKKIGLEAQSQEYYELVDSLFALMLKYKLDYTDTFKALWQEKSLGTATMQQPEAQTWLSKWNRLLASSTDWLSAEKRMRESNPVLIPRNHLVEQALEEAVAGDFTLFTKTLQVLQKPYESSAAAEALMTAPPDDFEQYYQTFCGT